MSPRADGALVIGQLSHAWLSGQLAGCWGNERFLAPEPRTAVALGAEQHDLGWALVDRDPVLSAESGLPQNFLELSASEHLAVWRGAPERLLSQSLHAALVVSLHGRALSELRARNAPAEDLPALGDHIAEERARQEQLGELLALPEEWLQRTQRQMWAWDGLSLALCNAWSPFTAHAVPTREGTLDVQLHASGDGAWTLTPWPFAAESVRARCEARRLEGRFESERELREAWGRAEVLELPFTLLPGEEQHPSRAPARD